MYQVRYSKQLGTAIAKSLEKHKQWGFVIVRCTYSSQEKWEKLIALVKQNAREYFDKREMSEVYEKAVWTIIEDPATLDGADFGVSAKRFSEWVWLGEGREEQEQEGRSVRLCTLVYSPRYYFYLHVDEESLESVLDEEKAERADGNCLKLVRADVVFERQARIEAGGEEEEDMSELLEMRKKVKIDMIVNLYAALLNISMWWNLLIEEGGVCVY